MNKNNPKVGDRYKYTRDGSIYKGDTYVVKNSYDLDDVDNLDHELVLVNEDDGGIWSPRNLFGDFKQHFKPVSDDNNTSYQIEIEMKITIDEV